MRLLTTSGAAAVMRWARRLTVLMAVLGLGVLLAPTALAGGTTSVLITSPSSGEAAALYASDTRYGSLVSLLGPANEGTRDQPLPLDGTVTTRQVNVTWMAHDLQPVRVDRILTGDSPGTVWIHTAAEVPATYRGYWHRAANPRELSALLQDLGVRGRPDPEKGGTAIFPQPWESADPTARSGAGDPGPARAAATSASAVPSGASGAYKRLDHWWWALPGLVVGAVLTLAALRSTGRRGPGPRQELLDR